MAHCSQACLRLKRTTRTSERAKIMSTTNAPKLIKQHPNRQNITKPSVEAINTKRRMWQTKQSKRSEQQFCKPELRGRLRGGAAVADGGPKAVTLALRRKVKLKISKLST